MTGKKHGSRMFPGRAAFIFFLVFTVAHRSRAGEEPIELDANFREIRKSNGLFPTSEQFVEDETSAGETHANDAVRFLNARNPSAESCRPKPIPGSERTGDGSDEAVETLDEVLLPVPGGGISDWIVTSVTIDQPYKKITFDYRPFAYYPKSDSDIKKYYIDFIVHDYPATCYVVSNESHIENGYLYFNQQGTSNGIPEDGEGDPTHTYEQLPKCWYGTDANTKHMKTYGCEMAGKHGMVSCFWNLIPDVIRTMPWIRGKLVETYQQATPWDDCDDHRCDGAVWDPPGPYGPYSNCLTDDGDIHNCLNMMAILYVPGMSEQMKKTIPYVDNIYIYALAFRRFVDEVEDRFNNDQTLLDLLPQGHTWNFSKLLLMGGSKRGRAAVGGWMSQKGWRDVAAFAGHCFGDSYARVAEQREKYIGSQGLPCHAKEHGMHQYSLTEYGERKDNLSSVTKQTEQFTESNPPITYAGGMQDTYFMTPVTLAFAAGMPSHTRYNLVPNHVHGGGVVDYLKAASCWAREVKTGQPRMNVTGWSSYSENRTYGNVQYGTPGLVRQWCTVAKHSKNVISLCSSNVTCDSLPSSTKYDPPDLRSAYHSSTEMTKNGGQYYYASPPGISGPFGTWQTCWVWATVYDEDELCTVTSHILPNENLCEYDPCGETV